MITLAQQAHGLIKKRPPMLDITAWLTPEMKTHRPELYKFLTENKLHHTHDENHGIRFKDASAIWNCRRSKSGFKTTKVTTGYRDNTPNISSIIEGNRLMKEAIEKEKRNVQHRQNQQSQS
ncbi:hypothetical protein BCT12_13930 [Vibrio breoganii]|nr:hypothetical protein BCT12_13930 [Vibrio breoganii]